ncbi:MAG: Rpn family recombination-promoting nuclease/putative transposase [Candidatus Methylumidiphilus sp.]
MSEPLNNPHDCFFRETFSRREVAEGFLRGYLPPDIVDGIAWESLEIAKDSFIEKALRNHFSDLLYTARWRGRTVKIYLLVEHKSHPDAWVPLQLLRYLVRIWELHRKQHPRQPLPPVLPLVLYHGQQQWQGPVDFHALFGETDAALAAYIPRFRHEFCDLALPAPAAIKGAVLSRLCLLALKHIFDADPKQALADILPLAREILQRDTALEMLEVVLRYYVQTTRALDENDIHELLGKTDDDEEHSMQTFIDRYIEQGRQQGFFVGIEQGREQGIEQGIEQGRAQGRAQGRQEGKHEGEQQGLRKVLFRQLARKFGALTAEQQQRIQQADAETLLRWSEQVLFAATVEEAMC